MTPAATLPSRHVTEGMRNALNRIYFHAMGLTREDLDGRPMVGVGTAWHGAAPAGDLPLRAARAAEEGVWAGGATPRQFATIAEVAGAPDADTLHPGLVTREIVADSVELTMRGHSYDALVGIAASPFALAGLMLGMGRLDVPSVLVPLVGPAFGSGEDLRALAAAAEMLGLALPGATTDGTVTEGIAAAERAGAAVAARVTQDITPRSLVTPTALRGAATRLGELGANPALLLHLVALASECGLEHSLADAAADLAEGAGRPAWVAGTLAPDGALLHGPAGRSEGTARVFDGEAAACAWLRDGGWPEGEVLVVRGLGPLGGPGMPALDRLGAVAAAAGPPPGALLITDGLAPALDGVTCVTAVGPEAAAGGPLARVRDGDPIALDALAGTLSLDVADLAERAAAASTPAAAPLVPVLDKYRRTVRPAAAGATTHPGAAQETKRYADA